MNIYVDTREPEYIRIQARKLGFIPMALETGDFSTDKVIFERKEIGDFVNSTFARYGETSRLTEQMERLFTVCQSSERIPFLLIHGRIEDVEKSFAERNQKLNRNAIYGSVASVFVRYAINIIWSEQPIDEILAEVKSIAEKIDEGKLLLPQRKKLKEFSSNRNIAVVARTFDLNPKVAELLVKRIGPLNKIVRAAEVEPSSIFVIEGVGSRTLRKIQEYCGLQNRSREFINK